MSDIRALLVGRDLDLGEGSYVERLERPAQVLEEWLRGLPTGWAWARPGAARRFTRRVGAHAATVQTLSDQALRAALLDLNAAMRRQGFADPLLSKAFAIIREAAHRTLNKRHHDVQLLAGRALLRGTVAEMATGEGKTLAATLGVCTAAAAGAAVHVVTVNDYLAARDAEENLPLYHFFGFGVGVVQQDMPLAERRRQYQRHIVYVSNKELTFDYLKDRIVLRGTLRTHLRLRQLAGGRDAAASAVLRGLQVAIVDEADSVFIDEARTPLIISETLPDDLDPAIYRQALALAQNLVKGEDFLLGKQRDVWLTAQGETRLLTLAAPLAGLWLSSLWRKDLVHQALSALHLFQHDQHYITTDNKVQIVDEFTGRVMPDRTWERGLHQMIEAKEGCAITGQRRTLAQITYQRFFGRYVLLAGMTGTASEVGPELRRTYDLPVRRIPTHRPSRRVHLPDRVFASSDARWQAVASRASEIAAQGRAVLIGTRSVAASEKLGALLSAQGVAHALLNARQDKEEAAAIAAAGQGGRITVATNMAGRGTDIKLSPEVFAQGGLHVILTEFHESARVDRQLFGRAARQGDPGSVEAIVCLGDELLQRYAPWLTQVAAPFCLAAYPGSGWLFRALIRHAQGKAERQNRRVRLDTLKRDRHWLAALGFVGAADK